jgi:hypothetical protein
MRVVLNLIRKRLGEARGQFQACEPCAEDQTWFTL